MNEGNGASGSILIAMYFAEAPLSALLAMERVGSGVAWAVALLMARQQVEADGVPVAAWNVTLVDRARLICITMLTHLASPSLSFLVAHPPAAACRNQSQTKAQVWKEEGDQQNSTLRFGSYRLRCSFLVYTLPQSWIVAAECPRRACLSC